MIGHDWTHSDKFHWHQYIDTYRRAFDTLGPVRNVLEYGVLHGDSIRWLRGEFPDARIVGADILEPKDTWPQDEGIRYVQFDQGDRAQVRRTLDGLGTAFDLVIEDGSHIPQHQALCLSETLPHVRSGGLYILEDIQTSHPEHGYYHHDCAHYPSPPATSLHVLLAIQHLRTTDARLTDEIAERLATPDFFTVEQVYALFHAIASLELYKRTSLPPRCLICGGTRYDYVTWLCECGKPIYRSAESMSFLVRKA